MPSSLPPSLAAILCMPEEVEPTTSTTGLQNLTQDVHHNNSQGMSSSLPPSSPDIVSIPEEDEPSADGVNLCPGWNGRTGRNHRSAMHSNEKCTRRLCKSVSILSTYILIISNHLIAYFSVVQLQRKVNRCVRYVHIERDVNLNQRNPRNQRNQRNQLPFLKILKTLSYPSRKISPFNFGRV